MDYEEIIDVECDGCCRPLGACYPDEWERIKKKLILCKECDIHCVSPDTLRRVGMTVLASQVENQWKIERSMCDYRNVYEGRSEDDGIPF